MEKTTISLLLLLNALLLTSKGAEADCKSFDNTFNMPTTLVVPRDLPVGSMIGNEIVTPNYTFVTGTCNLGATELNTAQSIGIKVYLPFVTTLSGRRIFEVPGLPGIGYALGLTDTFACRSATFFVGYSGASNTQITCANSSLWPGPMTGQYTIAFYKTAEVTASGSAGSFGAGSFIVNTAGAWMNPESGFTVTGVTAKTTACTISNSVINVKLDAARSSDLRGVGSTTGSTPFNISLKNCDAGLNLSLSLNAGSGGSSDLTKGLLTADSTSADTGLALQLMYGNAPVNLGALFSVQGSKTTSGGNYDIPLVVRYFQTGQKIKSGKVNATATFTMAYN